MFETVNRSAVIEGGQKENTQELESEHTADCGHCCAGASEEKESWVAVCDEGKEWGGWLRVYLNFSFAFVGPF